MYNSLIRQFYSMDRFAFPCFCLQCPERLLVGRKTFSTSCAFGVDLKPDHQSPLQQ